jgi:Dehydrogenase E1 component
MHTSVEKHALRIAKSCGTLAPFHKQHRPGTQPASVFVKTVAHASGFSFFGSRFDRVSSCIRGISTDAPPLSGFVRRYWGERALQSFATASWVFPSEAILQGLLLNMPRRPSAVTAATSHPLISNQRLQHLYITLLRTRLLRQRNRLKERSAPLVVREAIVTGTVTHFEDGDAVMPVAGDHLAALAFGRSLRHILAGDPLPGILASTPAVEARFAIATGHAMARQGTKHVTLAFSGPGLATIDALRPSLAYAAQHKLGIVFVIESAANTDLSSARSTEPLGIYGIPVDGNDVVAIYRVAQEAIHRARRGVGPTLIDCKPWLLDGDSDPVRRLEQALERRGIPTSRLKQRTLAAFRKELGAISRKQRKPRT